MTLNLNVPTMKEQLTPKITVIGVGGAGGNAVNNMIQNNLEGVEFLVTNTDSQALAQTLSERSIQLGRNITQGLGAGSRPDIGRAAAEEVLDEILAELDGSNMIFVTAGMGGGTGTGAAPAIARAAREAGILTVGVVTKPFHFEGVHRMRLAEAGINELQQYVDTLIIIPNQNLFRVANEKTTFADAFKMADDVLDSGVRGVTDLMVMPGLINLDFADIRAVMTEMGKAMMGTGEAEGDNRAIDAAEAAISNPLLDDVSMKGARGVLINITGGADMTLFEVDEAANRIRDEVDPEANIIFGSTFVQSLEGRMRVSVVSTGIDADQIETPRPVALSLVSDRGGAQSAGVAAPNGYDDVAAVAAAPNGAGAASFDGATATAHAVAQADPGQQEVRASTAGIEQHISSAQPAELVEPPRGEDPMGREAPHITSDAFMAPPPVQPETRQHLVADAGIRPERSAEAEAAKSALEPGRGEPAGTMGIGRKKAQSLLARMSGAARAIQGVGQSSDPAPQVSRQPEPRAEVRPEPVTAPPAPPSEPVIQPQLSGLDPDDGIGSNPAEEELLDIPAFLRRQAN